jgi:hypothetical protein
MWARMMTLAWVVTALGCATGILLDAEVRGHSSPPVQPTATDPELHPGGDPSPSDGGSAIPGDPASLPGDAPNAGDPRVPGDPLPPGDAEAAVTAFDDMLLVADSGLLVDAGGNAVPFRGAISCCMGGFGWPLVDEAFIDRVAANGVTFLHMRLGPFLTGSGGESDWAGVGGGYVEVSGKADLTRFNPTFWARVAALLEYAGSKGLWVEVDVADGWAVKHCRWGDLPGYSAWGADGNIQGEDWCGSAGSREILGSDVHEQWVRKVVRETGRFGNVLYEDGNEIGLVSGYAPEWSLSIRNIIHDEEARRGYGRHLLGTNSGSAATIDAAGIDYVELHQKHAADPSQGRGKPCLVNEYNPNPPLTPDEFMAEYCAAEAAGTYFWYWRHEQSDEQMAESLSRMQAGCD